MHAGPPSEPKDTTPMPPGPSTLGMMNSPPSTPDLFCLAIILAENLNTLKQHINAKKQARRDDPNHVEAVSEDEEDVDLPVSAVPVSLSSMHMSLMLQQLPSTINSQPVVPLELPEISNDVRM